MGKLVLLAITNSGPSRKIRSPAPGVAAWLGSPQSGHVATLAGFNLPHI
jgi:hypothetical protein